MPIYGAKNERRDLIILTKEYKMNLKKYDICCENAIKNWDEALPLGNGKLGCLLYGDNPIKIAVDRVDLWDTRPHPYTLEEGFNYKNMEKLAKSGKKEDWAEFSRLFDDCYSDKPYPSKITAGRLELYFGEVKNVRSSVDITRAVGFLEHDKGKIELITSATDFICMAKVFGEYSLKLHVPDYITASFGYPAAEIVKEGDFTYYLQETKTNLKYGVVVLEVMRERFSELYFTVANNKVGDDFIRKAKDELLAAAKKGYEKIKREHIAWWKKYWAKSSVKIGDELLEKTYYRSYYLFASCSRSGFYPMPLQGVWTADNDCPPPWKGDYHHDTNTQLSYQSYLKANRLSEGRVFIDYLWSLKPQFEKVARDFYGVNGLIIPGVSTIDGKPMGGWGQYSLSPTMSIWSAQSFDEYYLYTGDEEFLKNRAYPFLSEIGDAILGLLREQNGKLYLPLSSSPEIHDNEPSAFLKPNSNFDLSLMRYLFSRLKAYGEILGVDCSKYSAALEKLDDIQLIDGAVELNSEERLEETHRHFSHLMCMYPLHLLNYDSEQNKKIYDVTIYRIEKLGMGMWVGFSYAMCAQIYAMALIGNSAYEKLRQFCDGFVSENGFHLNGDFKRRGYSTFHYRPFTLEASFGFCDALQEMLLQEHLGYIHLFPAVPNEWENREIGFENLRSYGGVLVSAKAKCGVISEFSLNANRALKVKIKNVFGKTELNFSNGQKIICDLGEIFELNLSAGEKISLIV